MTTQNHPALTFRKATTDDLAELRALVQAAVAHLQANGNMQWDERYPLDSDFLPDIQNGFETLGFIGNKLAVIYALSEEADTQYADGRWQNTEKSFTVLHRFIVHPRFQGQGVAKETLSRIIGKLQSQGIGSIRLDTYRHNAASQHLYHSFGFHNVGIAYFRDKAFDLMELIL